MKMLTAIAAMGAALVSSGEAAARAMPVVLGGLKFETVYETAERSILARDAAGKPLTVLLKLDRGDFLPPHGADGGVRLLTVLKGDLSWGDGAKVDPKAERVFAAGTILVIPAEGGEHWAAARSGDVLLQIVVVPGGGLEPGVAAP